MADSDFTVRKGLLVRDGNVSLRGDNKELRFYEGANYVGFEAPALSADKIWVLPAADGSTGQALKTDGSGNLGWVTAGDAVVAGSNTQLQYNASGSLGAIPTSVATFDGTDLTKLTIGDVSVASGNPLNINVSDIGWHGLSGTSNLNCFGGEGQIKGFPNSNSASKPMYAFNPPGNSGMFASGSEGVGFTVNGTERLRIHDAGQIGIGGANYGTDGQVLTSTGASSAPAWEDAAGGNVSKVGTPVNNQVGVWTGDGTIEGDAKLTWDGTEQLELTDSDAGSGWGPILSLYHDSASPIANDGLGIIRFYGEDTAGNKEEYARIRARIADANSGSEDAYLKFGTVNAGTLDEDMLVLTAGGVSGTVIKDENNLASNSATHLATQQSIKAYVDASGGASTIGALTDVTMDATNFVDGILIQADSNGSAPTTGTLSSATGNVGIGKGVFTALTSGTYNTGIGHAVMDAHQSGEDNVAIGGRDTMGANTTGSRNVALGSFALSTQDTHSDNVGIGYMALRVANGAEYNVAVGNNSLKAVTSGGANTAIGYDALTTISTVTDNTAVGFYAGKGIDNGGNNTAIGSNVLSTANSATQNTAVGSNSQKSNSGGSSNTSLGYRTLYSITSGTRNIAIGVQALDSATDETDNIAIGHESQYNPDGGDNNISLGNYAFTAITTGGKNTAIGHDAGKATTTAGYSTYMGYQSGYYATTQYQNTAFGANALYGASGTVTGGKNTAVGYNALKVTSTGNTIHHLVITHFSR